jgi:hypothetical protein
MRDNMTLADDPPDGQFVYYSRATFESPATSSGLRRKTVDV